MFAACFVASDDSSAMPRAIHPGAPVAATTANVSSLLVDDVLNAVL
jgi:hypothetical protein